MAGDFRYGFIGEGDGNTPIASSYVYAFFLGKSLVGQPLQHGVGGFHGAVARWDNKGIKELRAFENCCLGCSGSDVYSYAIGHDSASVVRFAMGRVKQLAIRLSFYGLLPWKCGATGSGNSKIAQAAEALDGYAS